MCTFLRELSSEKMAVLNCFIVTLCLLFVPNIISMEISGFLVKDFTDTDITGAGVDWGLLFTDEKMKGMNFLVIELQRCMAYIERFSTIFYQRCF